MVAALVLATLVVCGAAPATADRQSAPVPDASAANGPGRCGALRPGLHLLPEVSRKVWTYVPRSVAGTTTRSPVVILLHGSGGNGTEILETSRMAVTADAYGFTVVMPSGGEPIDLGDGDEHYVWEVPGFDGGGDGDDAFLARLIPTLPSRLCADPARVYMSGFSGGARMTSQFACRHRDLLAAIGPVAGLRAGAPEDRGDGVRRPGPCPAAGPGRPPLTVVAFHGTGDVANPYDGDPPDRQTGRWGYAVPGALSRWASIDRCTRPPGTGPPIEAAVPGEPTVRHLYYTGCAGGATVQLFRITGGTHVWPTTRTFDVSEVMWRRFAGSRR